MCVYIWNIYVFSFRCFLSHPISASLLLTPSSGGARRLPVMIPFENSLKKNKTKPKPFWLEIQLFRICQKPLSWARWLFGFQNGVSFHCFISRTQCYYYYICCYYYPTVIGGIRMKDNYLPVLRSPSSHLILSFFYLRHRNCLDERLCFSVFSIYYLLSNWLICLPISSTFIKTISKAFFFVSNLILGQA